MANETSTRTVDELEAGLRGDGVTAHLGAPDLDRIRREGRRHRLTRRAGGTAAGLAAAAAVAGIVLGGQSLLDQESPDSDRVAVAPRTDEALLEQCRNGNQSEEYTELLYGSGTPVIKAQGRTSHKISLAIESADGKTWGDCFIHLDDQEFASGIEVHPTAGEAMGSSMSYGPGCGLVDGETDPSCTTFSVSKVERRPLEVAAVEFVTADGVTTTVRTQDGYYAFEYLGDLPPGTAMTGEGLPMRFEPVQRITFLDNSGAPIAAEAQDGSGTGPDRNRIGDLPLLTTYPVQGGDPIY